MTETQSKYETVFNGRMRPDPCIAHHPAYATLFRYATKGCPVNCGEPWSREHLKAAIQRGPHISAKSPEAAACLRQEAFEKVEQGEAEIIRWDDIKDAPHKNLKISPLAAVPHKSRQFRAILDLSFQLRLLGVKLPSVNEATLPLSDHKAMEQMGQVLRRLIHTVAQSNPAHGPVIFAKWDIKDGFWRLVVSEQDAWHFCYVLPRVNEDDPILIVKPTCLQMGWSESPPLFCTASETARDIIQEYLNTNKELPQHPLEALCVPFEGDKVVNDEVSHAEILRLMEVYMDDFIGLAQALSQSQLVQFTRAVLHGIHMVFPPPDPEENKEDEPISIKKLKQGDGMWTTKKEILGWLFDGVGRCIQLPADKVAKITQMLKDILRKRRVRFGDIEKINGKLMHATIGIPNGKGLLSPLIAQLTKKPKSKNYKDHTTALSGAARQAIKDWITLLPVAMKEPTLCLDLVPAPADFGGYCDASKAGAGGVWFGLSKKLPPIVWRVEFPPEVQQQMITHDNPNGTISNSDLEMTGLLLHWIVLELCTELAHSHVACWCDNTPTVAWASKLLSTKATTAANLLRTLALRMLHCRASPLTTLHVEGDSNKMADFALRSFNEFQNPNFFLTEFHIRFPLPQDASWNLFQLPNATIGRVCAMLSTKTPTLESWHRLAQRGSVIGGIGRTFYPTISIHTFKMRIESGKLPSYSFSLDGSGRVQPEEDVKSKPVAYKQHLAPSARPLNWLGLITHCTEPAPTSTTPPSLCKRKRIGEQTR